MFVVVFNHNGSLSSPHPSSSLREQWPCGPSPSDPDVGGVGREDRGLVSSEDGMDRKFETLRPLS